MCLYPTSWQSIQYLLDTWAQLQGKYADEERVITSLEPLQCVNTNEAVVGEGRLHVSFFRETDRHQIAETLSYDPAYP